MNLLELRGEHCFALQLSRRLRHQSIYSGMLRDEASRWLSLDPPRDDGTFDDLTRVPQCDECMRLSWIVGVGGGELHAKRVYGFKMPI